MNTPTPRLLGKQTTAPNTYTTAILDALPRLTQQTHAYGSDIWTCYELSWLDANACPKSAIGQIIIPCNSPFIVESKSLKLYLNAFYNHQWSSITEITDVITRDLSRITESSVSVTLYSLSNIPNHLMPASLNSHAIIMDDLIYSPPETTDVTPENLCADDAQYADETLISNTFRSCCPVTNQPDWATVRITYQGPKIDKTGILRYLHTFRTHNGFHETCIERIFSDIYDYCQPDSLTVIGQFTRRGGIDITPIRSTNKSINTVSTVRAIRQ